MATKRIGLIGDAHAEHELLARAIDELQAAGATRIFCVGNVVDGGGDLARCCEILADRGVVTVRGNHDRWLLADLTRDLSHESARTLPLGVLAHLHQLRERTPAGVQAYLSALPATVAIDTRLGRALLCHGLGDNDMAFVDLAPGEDVEILPTEMEVLLAEATFALVLNGHTHRRGVRRFPQLTVVNAGTLHRQDEPGAVLVDLIGGAASWLSFAKARTEVSVLGELGLRARAEDSRR